MLQRLGLAAAETPVAGPGAAALTDAGLPDLVPLTLQLLASWDVGYGAFFSALASAIGQEGLPATADDLAPFVPTAPEPPRQTWMAWRNAWGAAGLCQKATSAGSPTIQRSLQVWNMPETPIRAVIERLWEAIAQGDDWQPLRDWLAKTSHGTAVAPARPG
jgi:uncharacterized protein YdiU (UPF0061 family)